MPPTIRDVAKQAGTTIGTVSKALNNSYTISGETTAHIKAVAQQMGYRPNARAKAFARRQCRDIAFLTHLPRDIAFTNPHMFEILAGAETALAAKGYTTSLFGCDADSVCALAEDTIATKAADGLLLHASIVTRELAVLLTRMEIPHIVIGKPDFANSLCWIDNNNQLSGELAAGHLFDLGRHDIAYIGGHEADRISQDRLFGVQTRLKEHGISLDKTRIHTGASTVESGSHMCAALLADSALPQAVICANNALAFGCLRTLQTAGIHVPTDIALMTFDDYPFARVTDPALSSVSIDVYEMGVAAGKLLVKKIRNPALQVQTFTTMPRLVVRGSTTAL